MLFTPIIISQCDSDIGDLNDRSSDRWSIPIRKKSSYLCCLQTKLHGGRFYASSELCFFVKSLLVNEVVRRSTDWPLLTFHRKLIWECYLRAVQFFKKINIFAVSWFEIYLSSRASIWETKPIIPSYFLMFGWVRTKRLDIVSLSPCIKLYITIHHSTKLLHFDH